VRKYTVILIPENTGGYSAVVPLLPECTTQGDTVEEALEMARDLLEGYLEVKAEHNEAVPSEEGLLIASVEVKEPAIVSQNR